MATTRFVKNPLGLADRDLIFAVFHHALHLIGNFFNDFEKMRQILINLSPGLQMVYFTESLDMQVQNGGFNQYFWNPSGRFALEALEGYQLIAARRYIEVLEAAITQFVKEQPKLSKFYRQGTLQAFSDSYRSTNLGDVDELYYQADKDEPIDRLRADFIRRFPEQFDLKQIERCYIEFERCSLVQKPGT